jgi:hypothetical protein
MGGGVGLLKPMEMFTSVKTHDAILKKSYLLTNFGRLLKPLCYNRTGYVFCQEDTRFSRMFFAVFEEYFCMRGKWRRDCGGFI